MEKRILVVDDESHFRFDVAITLRKAKYKISEATNGEEALSKILKALESDEPFDLLVTDIQMPKMSGIELIDALKKNNVFMPVLAVTGLKDKTLMTELCSRGYTEYLEKPFEPGEMIKRINYILKQEYSRSGIDA